MGSGLNLEADARARRIALAQALKSVPGTLLSIPFLRHLGVQSVRYIPGDAVLRLPVEAHLQNSFDMVHGGVTMTMLDVCMAMAARSVMNESLAVSAEGESQGVVTIEMKTSFLAPGTGTLFARGACLQKGASLLFCEGQLFDLEGALVAIASGTFKAIRKKEVQQAKAA